MFRFFCLGPFALPFTNVFLCPVLGWLLVSISVSVFEMLAALSGLPSGVQDWSHLLWVTPSSIKGQQTLEQQVTATPWSYTCTLFQIVSDSTRFLEGAPRPQQSTWAISV
jgi:hypothetical protein